jgi:hypothetical protein
MDKTEFLKLVLTDRNQINRMAVRFLKNPTTPKWRAAAEFLAKNTIPDIYPTDIVEAIRAIETSLSVRPTCRTCGSRVSFHSGPPATYAKFCSPRCGQLHPETRSKLETTMLERHGVKNALASSSSIKKSILVRRSIAAKGHWPGSIRTTEQWQNQAKKTVETRKKRVLEGVYSERYSEKVATTTATILPDWTNPTFGLQGRLMSAQHKCGFVSTKIRGRPICFACEAPAKQQMQWSFIRELEERYGIVATHNFRLENKQRLDAMFHEQRIGIEINGIYWHSQAAPRPPTPDYHQLKIEQAKRQNIRLITIWEDQIRDKKEIILGRFDSIFRPTRIGARKCSLQSIDAVQARAFFEKNHLDGWVRGGSSYYGLFHDGELVMAAMLGVPRYGKDKTSLELLRLATSPGLVIVGGISKILSKIQSPIQTYASLEWGGDGYLKAGFVRTGKTAPGYFYYERAGAKRKHRLALSKANFTKTTGLPYDNSKTEEENARLAGFFRCYTAGSYRYQR